MKKIVAFVLILCLGLFFVIGCEKPQQQKKTEPPKITAPGPDAPKADEKKADAPKPEEKKADAPKAEEKK
jgi:hypothetical protein